MRHAARPGEPGYYNPAEDARRHDEEHGYDRVSLLGALSPNGTASTNVGGIPAEPDALYLLRDTAATEIETRQVRWAWPGRLPEAVVAILEGDPDAGKSTIAATLAATFTRGTELPDEAADALRAFSGPVNVGYVTAEDDPAATLLPRFLAAGGNPRRLFFYDDVILNGATDVAIAAELLSLPRHVDALGEWITRRELNVCTIDVLSAFTDERVDSHNDASVRRMLTPLKVVAEETRCLLLVIRHLTKGRGSKAIYAGQGSIGYGAAARAVLTAAAHPSEPGTFVLAVTKGNLAPVEWRSTLGYRLAGAPFTFDDGTVGSAARLEWGGVVELTADEALAPPDPDEDKSARADAKEWLADLLDDGPVSALDVEAKGKQAGHSWSTLRRAKGDLGVRSRKVGAPGETGEWKWILAEGAHETPKMPRDKPLSTLSTFEDHERARARCVEGIEL